MMISPESAAKGQPSYLMSLIPDWTRDNANTLKLKQLFIHHIK